ncbi:MAG TPA: hypothetical protein VJ983_08195 [candidate division Zixibacteria bacterium]|nr:hypothetical protein [candidate division Zixibacteria bacterium]
MTATDGLFSINLGETTPLVSDIFSTFPRYLGMKVGTDPELAPRILLVTVPYSFRTSSIDGAAGGTVSSKVAIGHSSSNPGASAFAVGDSCTASGDFSTVGGGKRNSAAGRGSNVAGGSSNSANDTSATVSGGGNNQADGPYDAICGGQFNYTSGRASTILGGASNYTAGSYSVAGGHYANAIHNNCFVWNSDSTLPLFSTGTNQFLINATGGVGINLDNPSSALDVAGTITSISSASNGVEGYSGSNIASGVYGQNTNSGYGVAGRSNFGGTAVFGDNTSSIGYAGLFNGRLRVNGNATVTGNLVVSGTVTKGGGSFRIDHPLDPTHKYLYHSFVESPDMLDIYNGNVVTDSTGFATVTMPDWFEALNRDFRYQLTVMGGGSWARARIAREVDHNRFVIQTDLPNVKVSWQVTGVRHDKWADENRIPIEQQKPASDQNSLSSTSTSDGK